MTTIDDYIAGFLEEPGYLDYGRVGPLSATAAAEAHAHAELFSRARFGSLDTLEKEEERMRVAAAALIGFSAENIVFQPNTSMGLMHVMFGLTGGVLLSAADFPSITFAATRAAEALHAVTPLWLETDHGRVTPGQIRDQIPASAAAVAVSLVDSRTGYFADIEGIRQVIGDRLLIVDAIQGFGTVDAPYEVADVVAAGGHKWARAGCGTGLLALSDRALERITPVFSGYTGARDTDPFDKVVSPASGARAFSISDPDRAAQARLAAGLEEVASVGVSEINSAIARRVDAVIEMVDEFAISIISPRSVNERAGIVVLEPPAESLTVLTAALYNFGLTATTRGGTVRLSVHAATSKETLEMLRSALTAYAAGR